MGKLNIYDMDSLKNANEKRIWPLLSDYLDRSSDNICKCGICVLDMAAIILNALPPCYQTEENLEKARGIVSDEYILEEIAKAVALVSQRPHH